MLSRLITLRRPSRVGVGLWLQVLTALLLLSNGWAQAATARVIAASAAAAATAAPAPSASAAATQTHGPRLASEFIRLAEKGELVVAMLATDTPPFFYVRDGRLQGLDVDLAREIGLSLGLPVRFDRSAGSFNSVVEKISRGEADLGISKLSRTLTRSKAVLFSDPYLKLRHALILNRLEFARLARDRSAEQVLQSFTGRLGVIADSSFLDYAADNFPQASLLAYPNWGAVVAAVERGEATAGYRDEFEIKRVLSERPMLALALRTITLKDREDEISVAVGVDATALHAYINLFLARRTTKLQIDNVLKALPPQQKGSH